MAKRKPECDFLPPGDIQIKMTKNSTNLESLGETSFEYLEPTDPEQELSTDLLEELSPLLRLNDRLRPPRRRKPTKLKKLDEQVLNNKVILVRPKSTYDDNPSSKSPCINGVTTPVFTTTNTPVKPVRVSKNIDDINKLPKIKLNLNEGANLNGLIKTSPKMTIKMQAADPKLLNDTNFKEKVRKFCEETGKLKSLDNSMESNEIIQDNFNKNEACNSRVNFGVSTTTESTKSRRNQFSSVSIMADIFWGMMDKMKERSKDIELQSRISAAENFKDSQSSAKELMLRLSEKDKQIEQLEEINRDLTEKLRKEKLTGNQLRINLMRYQKQVIDLKNEVTLKTELMDEIYEASVKLRAYFEDGELCADEDDLGTR
ncbi:hypothetical protein KQX54_018622 [Cotesia glomerata]|uniref:Uncharacterized protein n=1 Tax=Cotesia glomerata TaxID=32391 RepID=A0AAV7IZZ6_COTGL|nr:hypothetical protein KQX54_018622 [Cotesia glomerata]